MHRIRHLLGPAALMCSLLAGCVIDAPTFVATDGSVSPIDSSDDGMRLQVTKTGSGTVSSSPSGISCGDGCTESTVTFDESPVTLSATEDTGNVFDGWTGACASVNPSSVCEVALSDGLTTVGATFRAICTPDTIVCDDAIGHYVDCSPAGIAEFEMDCPLGCSNTSEQCVDLDPLNDVAMYLDMARNGPDVAFAGNSTIDTFDGDVFNGATSIEVPSVRVGALRIFMFRSLSVTGTLKLLGGDAEAGGLSVVLVVDGDVSISGLVDASADGNVHGVGGQDGACNGGPIFSQSAGVTAGGGGGGHWDAGGSGGADGDGVIGGTSGSTRSDAVFTPLRGGCEGGFADDQTSSKFSYGGGGGGALQISSRTVISITGSGQIDASGGGGRSDVLVSGTIGGGGGGAGGIIVLEAPQIILDGAGVVLSTKGGGGAAAGNGAQAHHGSDGGTASGAALGGTNGSLAAGGNGGTDTIVPTSGAPGTTAGADGGGGGGSVGRVWFSNSAGNISPQNGAAIRSRYFSGQLQTRLVP